MKRKPVTSTNIVSVGWEDNTLEVEFKAGKVYLYFGVPKDKYSALLRAESAGDYFANNIKAQYAFQKVV